jgi:hypothetical protein
MRNELFVLYKISGYFLWVPFFPETVFGAMDILIQNRDPPTVTKRQSPPKNYKSHQIYPSQCIECLYNVLQHF